MVLSFPYVARLYVSSALEGYGNPSESEPYRADHREVENLGPYKMKRAYLTTLEEEL
jgi:hypothetical protein